jgi:hypothetical protein
MEIDPLKKLSSFIKLFLSTKVQMPIKISSWKTNRNKVEITLTHSCFQPNDSYRPLSPGFKKNWFISKLDDQIFNESLPWDRKERSASGGRRQHRRDIHFQYANSLPSTNLEMTEKI